MSIFSKAFPLRRSIASGLSQIARYTRGTRLHTKAIRSTVTRVETTLRETVATTSELGNDLQELTEAVSELSRLVSVIARQQQSARHEQQLTRIYNEMVSQRKMLDVLRMQATSDTLAEVSDFAAARQLDFVETLDRLSRDELSFTRFGDGELHMMINSTRNLGFQRNSPQLRVALLDVFTRPPQAGLMIGWPHIDRGLVGATLWSAVWRDVKSLIPDGVVYGDSHVSRPAMFDNLRDEGVRLWRQVWDGRKVCVITGDGSRFDLEPALFDNIADHRFLYSTPRDAFDDLDRILNEVEDGPDAELYLIALGPAGTVLATQLADLGHRAIDVGHISNSYHNVFASAPWPERMPPVR